MIMKGQYFSFDAIIASVIFMMAIVMLLGYWYSVKAFLEFQSGDTQREALRIASILFTPGFPDGADCDRMSSLGFAVSWNDRSVRESLLDCASREAGSNPDFLKQEFSSPYNVSINVRYVQEGEGSTTPRNIWIGNSAPSSESEIVKMRRAGTVVRELPSKNITLLATFDIYVYR
jgi:hypothetical protein